MEITLDRLKMESTTTSRLINRLKLPIESATPIYPALWTRIRYDNLRN